MMETHSLRSRIPTKSNHPSYRARRTGESQLWRTLCAYGLILVHLFLSFGVVIVMKRFVNNRSVSSAPREWLWDGLRSSDVMTIISAMLVAVRVSSSSLVAVSAWRCAFILLEKEGLDLHQFNWIVSKHLPLSLWMGASKNFLLVSAVLLLMLPSAMVAPLLSGSVDWNIILTQVDIGLVHYGKSNIYYNGWYYYLKDEPDRYWSITTAAGLYGLAWANIESSDTGSCRRVMNVALPVNSTVYDAILPCVKIHSITLDEAPFPSSVNDIILQLGATVGLGVLSPFFIVNAGNAIIFNSSTWNSANLYLGKEPSSTSLPPPVTFTGEKKVAVSVAVQNGEGCGSLGQSIFGDADLMGSLGKHLTPLRGSGNTYCYLVATVNFTAGVIKSRESVYVSSRVIQAKDISQQQIEPDRWVGEALYMMPDVMSMASIMNTSELATWGDVTGYIEKIVRYSYQASWDSMNDRFSDASVDLRAAKSVQMLQATVSPVRVAGWLVAQLLVTLASCILFTLQRKCKRQVIVDVAAAAITTDAGPLLRERIGLANMSYITKEDALLGKLRLAVNEETVTTVAHFTLGPS